MGLGAVCVHLLGSVVAGLMAGGTPVHLQGAGDTHHIRCAVTAAAVLTQEHLTDTEQLQ